MLLREWQSTVTELQSKVKSRWVKSLVDNIDISGIGINQLNYSDVYATTEFLRTLSQFDM